jgi:drug/metabolite transporter (DMT)-like permease
VTEQSAAARALPALLLVGVIWGSSFLFIEVLTDETGATEVVTGRLFFGMLAIGGYMLATRRSVPFEPKLIAQVSVLAVLSNIIPFALISWAQEHIESGTAAVLNSTMPVFTACFAAAFLAEERFTSARVAGLVLAVAGVAVLTGPDAFDVTDSSVLGQLAVIAGAACYGVGAVYSRTLLATQEPLGLSILQVTIAFFLSIPLMLVITGGAPTYSLSVEAWASLLALGILGTGLAYVLYLWLIEHIGSVRGSLVTYIIPIVAVFLGWAVLDETVGLNTIGGGLLIVGGVACVLRGQVPGRAASASRRPAGAHAR